MNIIPLHFKYTDKEMQQLLKSLTVLVDSREQRNEHILEYLRSQNYPFEVMKLDIGDYSVMLPKCPELGIPRDIYFPIFVERKNSVDELAQSIKDPQPIRERTYSKPKDQVLADGGG